MRNSRSRRVYLRGTYFVSINDHRWWNFKKSTNCSIRMPLSAKKKSAVAFFKLLHILIILNYFAVHDQRSPCWGLRGIQSCFSWFGAVHCLKIYEQDSFSSGQRWKHEISEAEISSEQRYCSADLLWNSAEKCYFLDSDCQLLWCIWNFFPFIWRWSNS